MMTNSEITFLKRLVQGPAVLFLGQAHLRLLDGQDSLLTEVHRKFELTSVKEDYSAIFLNENHTASDAERRLAWLHSCCRKIEPPWLEPVSQFAWSAVFSSGIDSVWSDAFRIKFRDIFKVMDDRTNPSDPRNRQQLHCTYLFGCVDQNEEDCRSPLDRLELLRRKQVAVLLGRRLPETATSLGTLVIEGYNPEHDWFSPEDLYPILSFFTSGQVHLFSTSRFKIEDPLLMSLARGGKIVLHERSLAQVLAEGSAQGFVSLGMPKALATCGHSVFIAEKEVPIPEDIWRSALRSATFLETTDLQSPPAISEDQKYVEFRRFLLESARKPIWEGFARGFAFRRDYQDKIDELVTQRLTSRTFQSTPIILYGQSGTGKSIALEALAYRVAMEKKVPVLHLPKRSIGPSFTDIDAICRWSEDTGGDSVLIVWDGMQDYHQYTNLLQSLASRGRSRPILVGSCYPDQAKNVKERQCMVEASARLSESELGKMQIYLKSLDQSLFEYFKKSKLGTVEHFLVALYRWIPSTRGLLRQGLEEEFSHAEQGIAAQATYMKAPLDLGSLAEAMAVAGIDVNKTFLTEEIHELAGEHLTEVQLLTDLVMVPGKFGLDVPIELLMRAMGKGFCQEFLVILAKADIFRLTEDTWGNLLIGPRHALEAQLVTRRLGSAEAEVTLACKLILGVSASSHRDNPEVQFAVDLLRNMGPNGQDPEAYVSSFLELAKCLHQLREERGMENSRLLLQEASLLREYAVQSFKKGRLTREQSAQYISAGEAVAERALSFLAANEPHNTNLLSMLLAEAATCRAARVSNMLLSGTGGGNFGLEDHDHILGYFARARRANPNNYHVFDVLAWSSLELLGQGRLDIPTRAQVIADALHAISVVDSEMAPLDSQELIEKRRFALGDALDRVDLTEQAFTALCERGSSAGYYLRALGMAGEALRHNRPDAQDTDRIENALRYLNQNEKAIRDDPKCFHLYFQLWWRFHVGRKPFDGERATLPFGPKEWEFCQSSLERLLTMEEFHDDPAFQYLLGIAYFHLGDRNRAGMVFSELARSDLNVGRRRVVRHYLASHPDGRPQVFTGQIKRLMPDGRRGDVYVEALRQTVPFFVHEFGRSNLEPRSPLPDFHIAFNYLGPIADSRLAARS